MIKKEKNNSYLSIFLSLALFIFLYPQQRPQEKVVVRQKGVPVRVVSDGETVKGLHQQDFELYENGQRKEITGFEIISKRLSTSMPTLSTPSLSSPEKYSPGRLFLLIFNVFDYNEAVEEGIDYFFQHIYQKSDRPVIVVENRLLVNEIGDEPAKIAANIKDTLKKYKRISSQAFFRAFNELSFEADRLYYEFINKSQEPKEKAINSFLENYKRLWDSYCRQFVLPDWLFYKSLLRRLRTYQEQKWAIIFQQREMFPQLKNYGRLEFEIRAWIDEQMLDPVRQVIALAIRNKLNELQRSFNVSNFPWENLQNLFQEENFTTHLLLLRSTRDIVDQDFDLREVSDDYESCLKRISLATGGLAIFSNRLSESLEKVASKEDYYYLLWYTPDERTDKERQIEVKVKKEGIQTIYAQVMSGIEPPQVAITDFKVKEKRINFKVINFSRRIISGQRLGQLEIAITILDYHSNVVFKDQKSLDAFKDELGVAIKLSIPEGSYFAIIEVVDKLLPAVDVLTAEIKI